MDQLLIDELKKEFSGDIETDEKTLDSHSHDASIFELKPAVVVFPKNTKDIEKLVKFVTDNKGKYPSLSLSPRAAGTDMSGGSLTESIMVSFQKYFNETPKIEGNTAVTQPGVFYRDFEKETLKHKLLYPPYPSSKDICAMGGIINNNAGGEKSLQYGKAEDYILEMDVVLSDGNMYTIKPLTESELMKKIEKNDYEGKLYKKIYTLIDKNYDEIMKAKPNVSKNSAGYYLWNVWDREKKIFDLTKLFVGAQGTLGIMTQAKVKLVPVKKHAEMLILYVNDYKHLAEIVNTLLPYNPESIESYDDVTLKLALKYCADFTKKMGTKNRINTIIHFLPEFMMRATGKLPKLTIQAEFTGDDYDEIKKVINEVREKLKPLKIKSVYAKNETAEIKYWLIRRDSFGLLRSKIKDMYASPFIDDIIVKPEYLPEFLPKFMGILNKYPTIIDTFAGHVGNGNFHVIPLVKLTDPEQQKLIPLISEEVFKLVAQYKGSTSGEHNDGMIRTPYLHIQFENKILDLFEETKKIFDPEEIFNPGKKVGTKLSYTMSHIRKTW
ncbi:MAG: FAD-binding oxidoreductase [Candidatus Levybacteria bacterium]|nr:FAD-binding oxidoreductase [Candidatus Levybacteria bacterium]